MTQMSAPVGRAVAVLNFLAGHAEQAFTLTEIAKSLRMSGATCHNLLSALVEAGYVYRTVGKTYVLGPALARIAQASMAPALVMQVARPEMRLLADEFDVVCSAYRLQGGESIIYERAAALSHINWNNSYLLTVPIAPPLGGIFFAWQEAEAESWLDSADPPLDPDRREQLLAALRFTRERGFTFGVRTLPLQDPQVARQLQNQSRFTDYALSSLEPVQDYQLAYVAAPVFARPDMVSFGLSLAGFVKPVKGEAIQEMGERLRTACDRIGEFIAGRELL